MLFRSGSGFVVFWDWESGEIVRRIDVDAKSVSDSTAASCRAFVSTVLSSQISWSGSGNLVAIVADDTFFVLTFNRDAYNAAQESGAEIGDEGVEEAFEVEAEISERFVDASLFFVPKADAMRTQCQDSQVDRRLLYLHQHC